MKIFVINPGSTSTKLAVYEDGQPVVSREYQHDKAELARFASVADQQDFRMAAIRETLAEAGVDTASIDGIAGRGGLLRPLEGGVYAVSDEMLHDLKEARYGEHPCNLGAVLAQELALEWDVPACIVDPVVTDEMADKARLTGLPSIERRSLFHALSQRGAARTASGRLGLLYDEANLLVCHMGGGISIGAHRRGRVVDVINALDGEGPFTPERSGGLPVIPAIDLVENGVMDATELKRTILREGGLFAHLGTNDPREVVRMMEQGDNGARLVFDAMAYSIAKHISLLAPALAEDEGGVSVDAVVLTGGMARSEPLVQEIRRLTGFLGPVEVVTGDEEMASLAAGVSRVLSGEEEAKAYHNKG